MSDKVWSMECLDNETDRAFLEGLTAADLLDWYFSTKDVITTQEAAFNESMRGVKGQLELIEFMIARKLDLESAKTMSSDSGRVTKVVRSSYAITDIETVMADVIANDRLHAFKLSPIKDEVEAMLAELRAQGMDVDCLPGVEKKESVTLRFTKAR